MLVGGDSGFQLLPLSHRLPRPSRHGGSVKGRSVLRLRDLRVPRALSQFFLASALI